MIRVAFSLVCLVGVVGCGILPEFGSQKPSETPAASTEEVPDTAALPVETPPPPQTARTPDQFDTTSQAERTAAVEDAQTTSGARRLGTTIATLGAVAEPGIWMKTPLVSAPSKGRVDYPANGTSVAIDLLPLDGDAGAGSQLSLAAMRLLGADLTGLPEVEVYASGS